MNPIEQALGSRDRSNRLVIKEKTLFLDLNKNGIQPKGLYEPEHDHGVGAVVISVVFRPIVVDLSSFDFGVYSLCMRGVIRKAQEV